MSLRRVLSQTPAQGGNERIKRYGWLGACVPAVVPTNTSQQPASVPANRQVLNIFCCRTVGVTREGCATSGISVLLSYSLQLHSTFGLATLEGLITVFHQCLLQISITGGVRPQPVHTKYMHTYWTLFPQLGTHVRLSHAGPGRALTGQALFSSLHH
jgi:hypothetical protein